MRRFQITILMMSMDGLASTGRADFEMSALSMRDQPVLDLMRDRLEEAEREDLLARRTKRPAADEEDEETGPVM